MIKIMLIVGALASSSQAQVQFRIQDESIKKATEKLLQEISTSDWKVTLDNTSGAELLFLASLTNEPFKISVEDGRRIEINQNAELTTTLRQILQKELKLSEWNPEEWQKKQIDLNSDGKVDLVDLTLFIELFNQKSNKVDFYSDKRIDDKDMQLFQSAYAYQFRINLFAITEPEKKETPKENTNKSASEQK